MDPSIKNKMMRWMELDDAIETRKAKLKVYTDEKKKLEDDLLDYVESNDMQGARVNTSDGFINFVETTSFQGVTLKTLKDALTKFFSQSPVPPVSADTLYEFVLTNRESKTKLNMKRTITG